jgi:hypothetical protein
MGDEFTRSGWRQLQPCDPPIVTVPSGPATSGLGGTSRKQNSRADFAGLPHGRTSSSTAELFALSAPFV